MPPEPDGWHGTRDIGLVTFDTKIWYGGKGGGGGGGGRGGGKMEMEVFTKFGFNHEHFTFWIV